MPLHSIVIPVYNEELGIETLFERMKKVLSQIKDECEVILVNDGSRDKTPAMLDELHQRDPRFKVLHFSRNFGHQIAITAGTQWAKGDTVTVMDADLQDPPEVILEFIQKWREGADVAYGVRNRRPGESIFKLWTAKIFYRVIRRLTKMDIPVDTGDFRLMDRQVVEAMQALPERHRYVRGLVSWVGYKQVGVLYDRASRQHGVTHYTLSKMIKLAFDGISSFSIAPLRLVTSLGFFSAFIALLGLLYALYLRFFTDDTITGWTSLIIVVLFLGAVQLIGLGMIGEYLGRAYDEVRQRPMYLLGKSVGFERDIKPSPRG